ncbi:MAG: type VI secretion system baseplate subunit TssG [Janthinobacterium lividum]
MVPDVRQQTPSLADQLYDQAYLFEFHQALKILAHMYPHAMPLGESPLPENEVIYLKSRILFSYPPSDLYDITKETHTIFLPSHVKSLQTKIICQVNFLGIAGSNGPLPMAYSEQIYDCFKLGNTTASNFLDIFNHRLLSIFHRIRCKYWIGLDSRNPEQTRIAQVTYDFLGLGTPHLQKRLAFPDHKLLFYAGLFWQQPRSTEGLKTLLHHYFKHNVDIVPFVGGWEDIEVDQQTRLMIPEHFNRLGQGAMLGTHVWNAMQKIAIQLGPLTRAQFHSFLPHHDQYRKLCDLIRFYLGSSQKFDIQFIIKAAGVDATRLGQHTYLGWSSWLKQHTLKHDDEQVILSGDDPSLMTHDIK